MVQESDIVAAIHEEMEGGGSGGEESDDARAAAAASEDKYIVKNKDTGEVFDIRDLANLPSDTYSIFPNDFLPPHEEEVVSRGAAFHGSLSNGRS